ncbi:MAG TPA: hypothetical protein VLK03_12850 [Nocardioides sp.]|nr:hypothetical protein [Nocardioides sp.]
MDIGESFQNTTDKIFDFLPNLVGFLLILLVGYIISKVVAGLVGKLLEKVNIDRHLHESSANRYVDAVLPGASPSKGIARIVFWFIFIFFITAAIGALGIPAATSFMNDVLAYLPNVIVAILIFIVAALVSGAVAAAAVRFMGDTPTGKIVGAVAPAVIMTIALFMILEQLQIAPEIVRIAFTAIMFALALGLALAFGLGGRDLAGDLLRQARDKGSQAASQAKQDAQLGKERAQSEMGNHASTSGYSSDSGYSTGTGYSSATAGSTVADTTPGTTGTSSWGDTSGQTDAGYDPEATQHMPPPAPPTR